MQRMGGCSCFATQSGAFLLWRKQTPLHHKHCLGNVTDLSYPDRNYIEGRETNPEGEIFYWLGTIGICEVLYTFTMTTKPY